MDKDILNKIINCGVQAPSGDNSQPWKFVISSDFSIKLYILPEKDNPVLNIHDGGTLVSGGAVILNIKIAAEHFGYRTLVKYLPDNKDKNFIALISFMKVERGEKNNDDLFNAIYKRQTNRRHYQKILVKETVDKIFKDVNLSYVKYFLDKESKDNISKLISLSEEVILRTKELHALLFKDVAWNEKQERKERKGLYVKTLEFNPIQSFVFWLCRKWNTISFLNKKINFAKIVGKQNSQIYESSGLIGFILIDNVDRASYIMAGELLQFIWLKATDLGLGFQPVTGLFFINEHIKYNENTPISKDDQIIISDYYSKIKKYLEIEDDKIILTSFRIGLAPKASARSSRLDPIIILE